MTEGWFAVAAAVMVVLSLAGAVVAVTADEADEPVGWIPDVPDVDAFEAPTEPGVATVDGETYDSVQAAVDAADPGDTIVLDGHFDERVVVETADVRIVGVDGAESALIDGGGEETVLEIHAENVTVEGVWLRESGYERSSEDAGVLVNGAGATLSELRITEITFGVWVDGVPDVTIEDSTIAGREDVFPAVNRGNGIHLHAADDALVLNNAITTTRDGIYYAWSENVLAEGNVMWNMRYGVHYMNSNDNVLRNNVAFDNDVGFALMVSVNLTIEGNIAVENRGQSSHGIFVKDIDHSEIRDNVVVGNGNGFYVYNANGNVIADNLVLANELGIRVAAGTSDELVVGNSFIDNDEAAFVDTRSQVAWNDTDRGNYWSDARTVDLDGDGTSEIRYQPAGTVERLVHENPQAAVFAESPAFDTVRLAESSFPVIVSPGAVDHHPLAEPNHDPREYTDEHRN